MADQDRSLSVIAPLIKSKEFASDVLPYIKPEYFERTEEKQLVQLVIDFHSEFNRMPSLAEMKVFAPDKIEQETMKEMVSERLETIEAWKSGQFGNEFLVSSAETYCQERAMEQAILQSFDIIKGREKNQGRHAIPEIMQDALAVSFKTELGHRFFADAAKRFKRYKLKEDRIPFDIGILNDMTNGGIPSKTLNIIVGGTNVGKTLCMCSFAAAYMKMGLNVLYFTMEMSEEKIAERIDANLLDIDINKLGDVDEATFFGKMKAVYNSQCGELQVKEYPTATANANHLRHFIRETKMKLNFKPDIILIDYLGIMTSVRGGNGGMYENLKMIAEEVRGIAVEFDVPIWSGAQFNRSGAASTDADLGDIAESFGLPQTADFMIAVIRPADQELADSQYLIKKIKSRYSKMTSEHKYGVVGVDYDYMRLHNITDPYDLSVNRAGQAASSYAASLVDTGDAASNMTSNEESPTNFGGIDMS